MNEDEYIKDRLDSQIKWYDKKATWNKNWHNALRVIEVVAAASIPFLIGYMTDAEPDMKVIVGVLGVLIAVSSGIVTIFKFQENWLQYRKTAECLKHHKYLYQTKTAPYDEQGAFNLFVESIEELISKENTIWVSYAKEKAKEK